jgi:hypothetical protein
MGSGRDKRKKVAAAKGKAKASGQAKTADKTAKKASRRAAAADAAADDDLDALLETFALADAARDAVTVEDPAPRPSPRVYASWTPIPATRGGAPSTKAGSEAVLVFGGERFEAVGRTERVHTFDDLFLLHHPSDPASARWARITSPGGPPPRSAHQAVCLGGFVYIFGGELTSRNMERFRHYRDLWRLDTGTWAWESLPVRGGPAARSGHRMVPHKAGFLLFGGFADDGKGVHYFNDTWRYDPGTLAWTCLDPGGPGRGPAPRGGGGLFVAGDALIAYGGHTGGQDGDDGDGDSGGTVHGDAWAFALPKGPWRRLPKAGFSPPPRASFGLAGHLGRAGILWGGITDRAGRGDRVFSEAHDDLFSLGPGGRWYPLAVRPPRTGAGRAAAAATVAALGLDKAAAAAAAAAAAVTATAAATAADPDPRLAAAATRIQAHFRGHAVRKAVRTFRLGNSSITELLYSPAILGADLDAAGAPRPRARAAPAVLVVDTHTLLVAGGVVEAPHTDVTLDDVWALNLKALDGWTLVQANGAADVDAALAEGWETTDGEEEGEDGEGGESSSEG